MKKLDLLIMVSETKSRLTRVRALAEKINGSSSDDDGHILYVPLLPEDDNEPYYVVIHLDRDRAAGRRYVYCSMHHYLKPNAKPPRKLVSLRKKGRTVEWFMGELRAALGDKGAIVGNVELAVHGLGKHAQRVEVPPVKVGDVALVNSGAEFRAEARGTGVQLFRWSEAKPGGEIRAWLQYVDMLNWPERSWWVSEGDRCLQYVRVLL